jgi:predicted membrane channel-forming protein YqfA (hemolysin III family)
MPRYSFCLTIFPPAFAAATAASSAAFFAFAASCFLRITSPSLHDTIEHGRMHKMSVMRQTTHYCPYQRVCSATYVSFFLSKSPPDCFGCVSFA